MHKRHLFVRWIPLCFVVLWATGFVGAKYGLLYAEPFTLLLIRMLLNVVVFALLVLMLRAQIPDRSEILHSLLVGVLIHAIYLGGVFVAIDMGMSAGVSSLLVGLQPITTAYIAWAWLKDFLQVRQIVGLMLGTLGVIMVVYFGGEKVGELDFGWVALMYSLVSLAAISAGALYQKKYCSNVNLISGALFQYLGASMFLIIPSFLFESGEVNWDFPLILVLTWMVLALSTVAVLLLMFMLREGKASQVASYFYLVPGVTAIMAWFLFGETLTVYGVAGLLTSAAGVYLVVRS